MNAKEDVLREAMRKATEDYLPSPEEMASRAALWCEFKRLPYAAKAKAARRLAALMQWKELVGEGYPKTVARKLVAEREKVSPSTLSEWQARLCGCWEEDFLPHLADRYK